MRIIITINTAWNIYNFRLGLIKALMNQGHEVIALAPEDKYKTLLEADGVHFVHIPVNPRGVNPVEDLKLISAYCRIFKELKPDIVLAYTIKPNIYATLCCQMLRIPIINNVSGLGTVFITKSLSSVIALLMYKVAFTRSNWVFFQNISDRHGFVKYGIVKHRRSGVLPGSGANMQKFYCERTENKGLRFLFVGRLIGDKGIREFLEASAPLLDKYPTMKLIIAGELGYNNKTALSQEELQPWFDHPQIEYLGMCDHMKEVYLQADVMVLPSYREGTSKALIEAAAMKLPIITTDVPGCREVIENGRTGFLCKPRSSADLQKKMNAMFNLPEEERLKMGELARHKIVTEFDEEIVIKLYLDKIHELTNK